jgi:predicted lipoprotein
MKKVLIVLITILISAFVIYRSVYFEKLDAKKQRDLMKNFNPKELVDYFWKNQLENVLKTAIALNEFDSLVKVNPLLLAKKYGKTVGISSNYCVLVKGEVKVKKDELGNLAVLWDGNAEYTIVAKYIFSNTVRDASGCFNVDNFQNTMDFNAVSAELNKRILKEVIANKADSLSDGSKISFAGAIEVNTESVAKKLEIVPLKLCIIKNE